MAPAHSTPIPDWVPQMTVGHWYRISGDRPDLGLHPTPTGSRYLADNDPAQDNSLSAAISIRSRLRRRLGRHVNAPWSGRSGFRSITEAWNGAVLATQFGQCGAMVCFGGGHNDYFGSDLHIFDLATRQWSRLSDGYVRGTADAYGDGARYPDSLYPDGSPLPPHTYHYVQYDPVGNDFILLKGQQQLGPNVVPIAIPHLFNLDTRRWRRGPEHPRAALKSAGWSAWDPHRRMLWGHSGDDGNSWLGFSPDGDNGDGTVGHWGTLYSGKLPMAADHNAMTYDTHRDRLVIAVHQHNRLFSLNPSQPAASAVILNSIPLTPINPYASLEFSHRLDQLIYYSACDGANIYSIAPPKADRSPGRADPQWRWQPLTRASNALDPIKDAARHSASPHNNLNHTFGRFRITSFSSSVIAILVRHIDSPVYAIKLC